MNIQDTANTKSAYAIGQPVKRKEDGKLLRGQGRYTDDVNLPNQAYAVILRSTIAHGRIKSINTDAAKTMPGVLAHLHRRRPGLRHAAVGAAVQEQRRHRPEEAAAARRCRPTRCASSAIRSPAWSPRRGAGQGRRRRRSRSTSSRCRPSPRRAQAVAKDAPAIFDDVPGNVCLDFHYGDTEKVEAASPRAKHKVKLTLQNTRMIVNAIEPRAAIGELRQGEGALHAALRAARA